MKQTEEDYDAPNISGSEDGLLRRVVRWIVSLPGKVLKALGVGAVLLVLAIVHGVAFWTQKSNDPRPVLPVPAAGQSMLDSLAALAKAELELFVAWHNTSASATVVSMAFIGLTAWLVLGRAGQKEGTAMYAFAALGVALAYGAWWVLGKGTLEGPIVFGILNGYVSLLWVPLAFYIAIRTSRANVKVDFEGTDNGIMFLGPILLVRTFMNQRALNTEVKAAKQPAPAPAMSETEPYEPGPDEPEWVDDPEEGDDWGDDEVEVVSRASVRTAELPPPPPSPSQPPRSELGGWGVANTDWLKDLPQRGEG